jgi:predicted glycoside hydrolase/deacetylase ChbG (UPF0249 family)
LTENAWNLEDIEKEFRAQIEMAQKHIPQTSHVSGHMGCTGLDEDVRTLVDELAKEYGLEIRSEAVERASYDGPRGTSGEKIESFIKMLEGLEAGMTYLFVDHPGLDSPELQAIHHIGYENVAADRQGVTDTWTDPRVQQAIESLGIQLIGYDDLKVP